MNYVNGNFNQYLNDYRFQVPTALTSSEYFVEKGLLIEEHNVANKFREISHALKEFDYPILPKFRPSSNTASSKRTRKIIKDLMI